MEKEQEKPLATRMPLPSAISPVGTDEEETAIRWRSIQYLHKRRCAICCCGCCGATVVILGITVLVLALTVFKVKEPTLTMNALTLGDVHFDMGTALNSDPVLINATLVADISIENPNIASFKFDNSTTDFYYHGETVGVAYAPDGEVSAHRSVRMNVTVDVLTNRVARQMNITEGALLYGAEFDLTSFTDISGRVNVLGVYKRDIEVRMNCSMTLEVTTTTHEIKRTDCSANVN